MSIQETPIRIVSSATYQTANRGALRSVTEALRGGDSVDKYFLLRAQSGKLMNAILNSGGFRKVSSPGLFKGQNGYFYTQGNSSVLVSFGVDEEVFNATLWEEKEFSAFVACQLGHSMGEVTHVKLKIDGNTAGPVGALKWKDLGDLVLRTLGQTVVSAFGTGVEMLKRNNLPQANGLAADKLAQRAALGVEAALDQRTELATANGNQLAFSMAGSQRPALTGLAAFGADVAATTSLGKDLEGISHNLIVLNLTDKEIQLKVSHQISEGTLAAGTPGAFKGITIPAYTRAGETTAIGTVADRAIAGEANLLWKNPKEDGNLGYLIDITLGDGSNRVGAGFHLPSLGKNSSFVKFNPAGSPADVYETNTGKVSDNVQEISLNDFGATLASNSHTERTPEYRSGKDGFFYRSILAIYDKTNPPKSWGTSALDGLFFGAMYTDR